MTANAFVRARIAEDIKAQATVVLAEMGLTVSDAVRILLTRTAKEKALPFELKVPNATTRKAMAELDAGNGKRFDSAEAMFKDLGI
jgi:DNA-damage-inducible protein J